MLHPNLPALYRRLDEALEEALKDEATALLAAEALRALIDAILVHPGERRSKVSLSLRGDLAAFLRMAEADATSAAAAGERRAQNATPPLSRAITGAYGK